MSNRNKPIKRASDGTFAPGGPGGPGRPAGTGEHRAALLRACSPEDVEAIVEALVEKAKQGDAQAARVLFDRIYGRPRDPSIVEAPEVITSPMAGPPIPNAEDFARQLLEASELAQRVLSGLTSRPFQ